jgi:S-methylmethionine-dependent homocysteine/selenocysteine methylase
MSRSREALPQLRSEVFLTDSGANASTRSHAELDEASELDSGDPVAFGREYAELRSRFPTLTVLGGCCGSDVRHIRQVALACL